MSIALNISESGLQPGVFWPGKLPGDWRVKRLKFAVRLVSAKAAYGESDLPYMGLEHIESWTGRYLEDEEASPDGIVSHFEPGDVLFGKLRPYLAKVHLARHRGVCSTEALVLRASEELLPEYLRYFLVAPVTIENINSSTYGSKMPRASWDFIGNQLQPLPPFDQQQKIAAFLDRKTAEIDTLIAKKRRLLDRLAEKRTALITRAVTKGLNPDAPMKDSGIEWLGEIPAHWSVPLLRHIAQVRGGVTKGRKLAEQETAELPYLRVANVQDGFLDLREVKTIEILASEVEHYSLQSGDVLMNEGGDNDKLGRGAVWHGEIEPCLHQNHVFAVRPKAPCLSDWLSLLTQSRYGKHYFWTTAKQSTNLASISSSNIKRFPVVLPPKLERAEIVRHVSPELDKFSAQCEKVMMAIDKLEEYRSALITNAVTGQIKVA